MRSPQLSHRTCQGDLCKSGRAAVEGSDIDSQTILFYICNRTPPSWVPPRAAALGGPACALAARRPPRSLLSRLGRRPGAGARPRGRCAGTQRPRHRWDYQLFTKRGTPVAMQPRFAAPRCVSRPSVSLQLLWGGGPASRSVPGCTPCDRNYMLSGFYGPALRRDPQGCRYRAFAVHRKRVTGIRAPGDRFEQWSWG